MKPAADLLPALRSLQWRMVGRQFLRSTVRAALVFYSLLAVLTLAAWWLGGFRPNWQGLPFALSWPLLLSALAGALLAMLKRPPLRMVAGTVDDLGGTCDRLLTAYDFSAKPQPTPLEGLAVQEAMQFVRGRDFRKVLPYRVPREIRWLALPLAVLAVLWTLGLRDAARRAQQVATAQAESASTVQQLEKLAEQLRQRGTNDETARRLAEQLKLSAAQVRAEAEQGRDGTKAALRELAQLEQLVQELRRPGVATSEELKALAQALAQDERTKDAARAMEQGKLEEAAQKLEEAAKDPATAERAQQAIQQALNHLAERKEQLSKQLEEMRQAGAGGGERQQLLQQLSEMLNEMQQQGKLAQQPGPQKGQNQGQSNQPMSDQDLKNLLGALQRMKDGQSQPGDGQGQGEGQGEGQPSPGQITMQAFSDKPSPGEGTPNPYLPSGQPGSEKDEGTTENPLGQTGMAKAEAERSEQLAGKLAEGETLSALLPSAAQGDAKATRRYRELTEAAAAQAAEAVNQEDIPLGARFLIRRYFDAIRP